jgi:hypothetical protein
MNTTKRFEIKTKGYADDVARLLDDTSSVVSNNILKNAT